MLQHLATLSNKHPGKALAVVDDDETLRRTLCEQLERNNFRAFGVKDGIELQSLLETGIRIDLITLDLNLGGVDGLTVARQLRKRYSVPIVMITSRAAPMDRVAGLESGADDYIVKPFHIQEVLLRVSSILHRYALETPAFGDVSESLTSIRFGDFLLDLKRRSLSVGCSSLVPLTNAEFDVLRLFLSHPGRILTRDELMVALKGRKWSPFDRTIDVVIARLRKKIERDAHRPDSIKTIWGIGYVFVGDVEPSAPHD